MSAKDYRNVTLIFLGIFAIFTIVLILIGKLDIFPINIPGQTVLVTGGMVMTGLAWGWHPRFGKMQEQINAFEVRSNEQSLNLADQFKDVLFVSESILTKVDKIDRKQSLNEELEDNIRECKLNLNDINLEMYLDRAGTILKGMLNEIQEQGFAKLTISGLQSKVHSHYLSIRGAGKRLGINDKAQFDSKNFIKCLMKLKGSETNNINNKFRRIAAGFINDYLEFATKHHRENEA